MSNNQVVNGGTHTKKALWGVIGFYLLIAFEMAYMAGPFAIYFYGVYNPILNFFNNSPVLSVLNRFFLPHVARTTASPLLNSHEVVGAIIAVIGFIVFIVGAVQIYYSKFARKGAVTGGIYRFVRHPQYTSFAVCGLGLLILWPRYINLFMFVTMLFVYYLLAKAEEHECEQKFGESYMAYKNSTSMFLPFTKNIRLFRLPAGKGKKTLIILGMYIASLAVAYGIVTLINIQSLNSLYAVYSDNSATLAVCELSDPEIDEIMDIVFSSSQVPQQTDDKKYLNYILPTEWFAAEIPMNGVKYREGHRAPNDYDPTQYKVILTQATLRGTGNATGKDIYTNVLERQPILEVWVDLKSQAVTQVLEIPENYKYKGVPIAVF